VSAVIVRGEPELFDRRYFLVKDKAGYTTIKESREDLDNFAALWAEKYPHCLPLTVRELAEVQP